MSAVTTEPVARPAVPSDEAVRRAIHRTVRSPELAAIGWSEGAINSFCDQQYEVRQHSYAMSNPAAEHTVLVLNGGTVVGELIVDYGPTSTTIVNIALLPTFRGQGIGTSVIEDVIARAAQRGVAAELTVDVGNPARSLYQRLGFVITASSELHHRMRRPSNASIRKDIE